MAYVIGQIAYLVALFHHKPRAPGSLPIYTDRDEKRDAIYNKYMKKAKAYDRLCRMRYRRGHASMSYHRLVAMSINSEPRIEPVA